jgi:hypothetical protein
MCLVAPLWYLQSVQPGPLGITQNLQELGDVCSVWEQVVLMVNADEGFHFKPLDQFPRNPETGISSLKADTGFMPVMNRCPEIGAKHGDALLSFKVELAERFEVAEKQEVVLKVDKTADNFNERITMTQSKHINKTSSIKFDIWVKAPMKWLVKAVCIALLLVASSQA